MKNKPQIVLRNGRPAAVILDIKEYEQILERIEQLEDLRILRAMRRAPLKFRRLADFLQKRTAGV